MKKLICLVLSVMMAAAVLTGCGGSNDKSLGGGSNAGGGQKTEAPAPADNAAVAKSDAYVVLVTDAEGKPIVGAEVQFCSDTMCLMQKTDETGVATFKQDPGVYTIHVLKVPEGYVKPEEEFKTSDHYDVTMITVEKQ